MLLRRGSGWPASGVGIRRTLGVWTSRRRGCTITGTGTMIRVADGSSRKTRSGSPAASTSSSMSRTLLAGLTHLVLQGTIRLSPAHLQWSQYRRIVGGRRLMSNVKLTLFWKSMDAIRVALKMLVPRAVMPLPIINRHRRLESRRYSFPIATAVRRDKVVRFFKKNFVERGVNEYGKICIFSSSAVCI